MPQRKIIVNIATSTDGYVARPDGNLDWLTERPPPKGFYGLPEFELPGAGGSNHISLASRRMADRLGTNSPNPFRPMQRTLRYALLAFYVSAFDHYIICWALNYLLARLENNEGWTASERWLAHELSPLGHVDCDCKRNKTKNRGRNAYGVHFPETAKILQVVGVQTQQRAGI